MTLEWVLYGFDDDDLLEVKHVVSHDRWGTVAEVLNVQQVEMLDGGEFPLGIDQAQQLVNNLLSPDLNWAVCAVGGE